MTEKQSFRDRAVRVDGGNSSYLAELFTYLTE